jgi:hypothetical protein
MNVDAAPAAAARSSWGRRSGYWVATNASTPNLRLSARISETSRGGKDWTSSSTRRIGAARSDPVADPVSPR